MHLKRLFDVISSFFGLIILLPVFFIVSVLIALGSKGPVIFKQTRGGRYGRPFVIYKFRTMRQNHHGGTVSVRGESRITPVGSFLRKYKIDELPELWNVLKGDMSIVGPRPDVPDYTSKLSGEERKILELRPGITGPASIKYKNEEELLANQSNPLSYNDEVIWPDKVKINLDYYYNRNFLIDIKLIFNTFFSSDY